MKNLDESRMQGFQKRATQPQFRLQNQGIVCLRLQHDHN